MIRLAIPLIHVSDIETAERFYCEGLGFTRSFSYRQDESLVNPCFIGIKRDGIIVHVSSFSGDGTSGGVVGLIVDDVDALFAEFSARGVSIDLEPTDQTWGNREMYVRDPDGNTVRFLQVAASDA